MKKIILVLSLLCGFTAASFAVDFTVGGNFIFGGNFSSEETNYQGFVSGGGAFINLDLYQGFGFQGEFNLITNRVSFSRNSVTFRATEALDIPLCVWYNSPARPISFGAGAGLNFSVQTYESQSNEVAIGLAAGANVIAYLGEHFGLVLAAHFIWDAFPQVVNTRTEDSSTYTFSNSESNRQSLCGSLGLQYRF